MKNNRLRFISVHLISVSKLGCLFLSLNTSILIVMGSWTVLVFYINKESFKMTTERLDHPKRTLNKVLKWNQSHLIKCFFKLKAKPVSELAAVGLSQIKMLNSLIYITFSLMCTALCDFTVKARKENFQFSYKNMNKNMISSRGRPYWSKCIAIDTKVAIHTEHTFKANETQGVKWGKSQERKTTFTFFFLLGCHI